MSAIVSDTPKTGAHCLSDLIERVDFAVRDRDVIEHRRLRSIGSRRLCGRGIDRAALALLVGALRLVANLRQDLNERLDASRIERFAGFLLDQRNGRLERHRLVIRAIRGQRVEVVDEKQNPRAERNVVTLQAARVSTSIPPLVVILNERCDGVRKGDSRDDIRTDLRMCLYLLELFGGQRSRLREDVLRHSELADVVQQRRRTHRLGLAGRHAELSSHCRRVKLHAADMVLGRSVLCVDRARERFDRRQVQFGQLLSASLLGPESSLEDAIRAQSEIEHSPD
jgi:hypothetical protein